MLEEGIIGFIGVLVAAIYFLWIEYQIRRELKKC